MPFRPDLSQVAAGLLVEAGKITYNPVMACTGYLAAEGYEDQMAGEIGDVAVERVGRLFLFEGPAKPAAWAANIWHAPQRLTIRSISDAAAQLRALQRNWCLYPARHFRRAQLIQERLPHVAARPLRFPEPPPKAPLGSWCLLAPDMMLAATQCDSPVPNGEWRFVEDREGPPNRAYLKLWEALTRIGRHPGPGELCLDLGASPGGWTSVLAGLGARVISVDKAPLAPAVSALPNVTWRQTSAFALEPEEFGRIDWLFSDVICYPARLLALVQKWLASGRVGNLVCTIKFQGAAEHAAVRDFAAIPGAQIFHLHHNKHELTFVRLAG